MKSSREDILNGNIARQLLIFLFPAFAGYLLQTIYSFADSIILGRIVGTAALAGVGATSQLLNIYNNFISGIVAAITIVVAQDYGKRSYEEVHQSICTGYFVSIILGIIMSLIGLLTSKTILIVMNTPLDIMEDALTYTFWYFLALTFYFIYNTGISIFRAKGDSKSPVYFIILLCVIKVGLDLILAGTFHMGVLGTSIATFVSYAFSAIIILIIFSSRYNHSHYSLFKDFGYDKESLINIFKIGIPTALQSVFFAITSSFVQTKINAFETTTVAAFAAYNQIDNFYWCFPSALSAGVMTIAGQNFGNKNMRRVKLTVNYSMIIYMVGTLIYSFIFYFFGEHLIGLFTTDQEVISLGYQMLKIVAITYFAYSALEIVSTTLKTCGDATIAMIISLIGICGVRILFLSVYPMTSSTTPIYCYPISWVITSIAFIIYFLCNKKYK